MSERQLSPQRLWARFRLAVVAKLLAAPPGRGELRQELEKLAGQSWRHPITGEPTAFGLSTIERWYYSSRRAEDPLVVLQRRVRADAGESRLIGAKIIEALLDRYKEHPRWSYWLHYRNLQAQARKDPDLGKVPSYSTIRRFMRKCGLMTPGLIDTVCERACGNLRTLTHLCTDLLLAGAERGGEQLDENLFLKVFGTPERPSGPGTPDRSTSPRRSAR